MTTTTADARTPDLAALDAQLETDPATGALDATALDQLFREARTVNLFTDEPVDPAEIAAAYDLAKWGPTAMNISPLRLAVVPRGVARERLVAHLNEGNRAKTLAAPLVVVAAADPRFHDHLDVLAPHRPGLAADLEGQPERRASMARTNALLQIGYFILALRAEGLQVGPMGGFDAAALDGDLFAESGWSSLLVLNVGRGVAENGAYPRAARLNSDEAMTVL